MQDSYDTLQIEARNLKMMWDRVKRQFTAEGFDRKQAERSYDWFGSCRRTIHAGRNTSRHVPADHRSGGKRTEGAAELRPMKKEN
jgi:hypothetical protein